jgi:uncharacterized protein (DUF1778 family)
MRKSAVSTHRGERSERLEARISAAQKRLFQRAAEIEGRTLSDFIVGTVHEAATRTIERAQVVHLSVDDSLAFAKALIDPPRPNPKLRAAFRRHRQLLGS